MREAKSYSTEYFSFVKPNCYLNQNDCITIGLIIFKNANLFINNFH